jgi:hypothetical protein
VVGTGVIAAITAIGNDLYVGGTFTNMGGVSARGVAEWDGTNWLALGSGISTPGMNSAPVNGLGASGPDLYVSGVFHQAGDKPSFNIAHWSAQENYDTPQLLDPAQSNGQFSVWLHSLYGLTNVIEATTNFTSWTPVLTNSTGIYDFIDTNSAAYPWRFYRAFLNQ